MNGKPVFEIPARISVINLESGFKEKLLCDGPTFSTGVCCVYTCSFCYVPGIRTLKPQEITGKHEDIVVLRTGALEQIRAKLTDRKGLSKFKRDPSDKRVIYASPLVDVAGNMQLVHETIEACKIILELTNWQIRLLSKSNLLPKIAQAFDKDELEYRARERIIFGVSTGTLDNELARVFEQGTPLPSKRIESLHWLQDNGWRTFGMICPSLPFDGENYVYFARDIAAAIRVDRCEHVWAEVINVRGDSMTRTINCLREGGYPHMADLVRTVATDGRAWEIYSRKTFEAHTRFIPPKKLRYLQYVDARNRDYWESNKHKGVILLGKGAH